MLSLDEATNALDSLSEELNHEAPDDLKENCAVAVIAYRLATLEQADQILVLDGELVEQGNSEVLAGLFVGLYKLQQM